MIDNLGKFEGCPDYAPYFWDLVLGGEGEYIEDMGITRVQIEPEDKILFEELEGYYEIEIFEDSNGFVHCKAVGV